MEMDGKEVLSKRRKPAERADSVDNVISEMVEKEESETNIVGSDEMELNINAILEKIELHSTADVVFNVFLPKVSELLESGKTMFKELSNDFEERIHKEQMDKWQEEIKDIRMLDVSNEKANAILENARTYSRKELLVLIRNIKLRTTLGLVTEY